MILARLLFMFWKWKQKEASWGKGILLSFHYSPNAIEGAMKDLKRFVLERKYHVYETLQLQQDYEAESEYFGIPGLQRWALATLNVALWDAWARTLGHPIYRLFGCSRKKIPVYGSGGWISYTDEELLEEVKEYQKRGFQAVKIKVGSPDQERDVRRLHLVREAIGPNMKIMMDANQGMDVPSSVSLIEQVKHLGIHWFEEPVSNTDFEGYALIHQKTSISLAMGEREYSTVALREAHWAKSTGFVAAGSDPSEAAWRPGETAQRWQPHTISRCCLIIIKTMTSRYWSRFPDRMARKVLIGSMELSISRWRLSMDMHCQEKERAGDSGSYIST